MRRLLRRADPRRARAIGLGTAVGFALFGTIAILAGAAVMAFVVIRRRRRAQACSSSESSVPVPVELTTMGSRP